MTKWYIITLYSLIHVSDSHFLLLFFLFCWFHHKYFSFSLDCYSIESIIKLNWCCIQTKQNWIRTKLNEVNWIDPILFLLISIFVFLHSFFFFFLISSSFQFHLLHSIDSFIVIISNSLMELNGWTNWYTKWWSFGWVIWILGGDKL